MGGVRTPFLIDSGANINTVSEAMWVKLGIAQARGEAFAYDNSLNSNRSIFAYASSSPLQIIATFRAWIVVTGASKPHQFADFYVIRGATKSLLSRLTAKRMKLLKMGLEVNELSSQRGEVEINTPGEASTLKPFPKVPGGAVEFEIDDTIVPLRHNYFNVPEAFREPARKRLKEMELQDIIEPVHGASKWVSGMSAVTKGDKDFRLVVNMRGPNKAIRRRFYHLPTMEELKCRLSGAKVFSKLDLSNAFYHIELGERSRQLTTFMTEDGTFRFKRLLFGVNCAPEMFQEMMERVLRGCEGVVVYIDDILVYAETSELLSLRTDQVLKALKANNLTLNKSKCEFNKKTVRFLGHNLSRDGFDIDESKVEALGKFRQPRTASELRSFLGLATYMSSFIPHFADITAHLWKSAQAHDRFVWGQDQREAFTKVKDAIKTCTVTQGFFDRNARIELYTDASPVALGAVLTQVDQGGARRIISFASKSLSEVERRYPQNQREALGIVWGVEKFFFYLLGRKFTIKTDAQGTAFIFKRTHQSGRRILSRAEGWALRLNPYDSEIKFIRGSENIADTPSRLFEGTCASEYEGRQQPWEVCNLRLEINNIDLGQEAISIDDVRTATEKDLELQTVLKALKDDVWDCSDETTKTFRFARSELYEHDGLLLRNDRIVMPGTLRSLAIKLTHLGHLGMSAMKRTLRARVWWPFLDKEVETFVARCMQCSMMARKDPPPPMKRIPMPSKPWEYVAIDFCGPFAQHGNTLILVLVDYYSRLTKASIVKTTDRESTVRALDALFEVFGYPCRLQADNGPPFSSRDFKADCNSRGIQLIRTVPYWPQHNGLVENAMKGIDKIMKIAHENKEDYRNALKVYISAYNSAPHSTTGEAPEELMMGRLIRRRLPMVRKAQYRDDAGIRDRDWQAKTSGKETIDKSRGAKVQETREGDKVIVLSTEKGKLAPNFGREQFTVVGKLDGDLRLRDEKGKEYRRHISHTKRIPPELPEAEREAWPGSENPETLDGKPSLEVPENVPEIRRQALPSETVEPSEDSVPVETGEVAEEELETEPTGPSLKRHYVKRDWSKLGPARRSGRPKREAPRE